MPAPFQSFHPRILETPYPSLLLHGDRVEYLALAGPEKAPRSPILLLPGVLQDFRSLLFQARRLLAHRPVLLVALPGQGSNRQLAPHRDFSDLARLLAAFLETLGVESVLPLGFSYGAAIAYVFCASYQPLVEKAILGGVFHEIHEPFRAFLVRARHLLTRNHMSDFASHLTRHMINQQALERTGISPAFQRAFHHSLQNLADIEKERYLQNINRLIEIEALPGTPATESLFYAGRQDSFASPAWVRNTACRVKHSRFALIEGADHMVTATRKEVLHRLFAMYISQKERTDLEGVTFEEPARE